ncbi:MAG: ABC transporter ATP-binding protein [Gammaproteobacteria bacterium]|nr:ABC transporter ATP-binding protein [Gammaproteobacteria bacterium]
MNTENQRPLVELRNLNKVFVTEKVETHALSEISFAIERGEYLLVQGPSGCGKSILGLLEQPTSGQYLLAGTDTRDLGLTRRARLRNEELGFVFQSFNLIGDLTILENVELPLRYRKGAGKIKAAERAEKAMELLEIVGIAHRAEHYPAQLSGGQQQRAAVARALIAEPSLILADEPTGNLDSDSEDAVMALLADSHAKGTTLCVVSHNPKYADVANRTLELSEGRLTG